jgi:hypothetical protein
MEVELLYKKHQISNIGSANYSLASRCASRDVATDAVQVVSNIRRHFFEIVQTLLNLFG